MTPYECSNTSTIRANARIRPQYDRRAGMSLFGLLTESSRTRACHRAERISRHHWLVSKVNEQTTGQYGLRARGRFLSHRHEKAKESRLFLQSFPLIQYFVDDAPFQRLLRSHEKVPLHHFFNLLQRMVLRQMFLVDLVQLVPYPQDLLRMDRYIVRLPAMPPARLVYHDGAMGQTEAAALGATAQQQAAHGARLAHADGAHGRAYVRHGIVDGQARAHGAAGRVNVQRDRLLRRVGFEEEELRDDVGRGLLVDGAVEADYPLLEEPRVYVV